MLTAQATCDRCERRPAIAHATVCYFDVLYLTRRAVVALAAIRERSPGLDGDRLAIAVRAYVDSGHEGHHYTAKPGCIFCLSRS